MAARNETGKPFSAPSPKIGNRPVERIERPVINTNQILKRKPVVGTR